MYSKKISFRYRARFYKLRQSFEKARILVDLVHKRELVKEQMLERLETLQRVLEKHANRIKNGNVDDDDDDADDDNNDDDNNDDDDDDDDKEDKIEKRKPEPRATRSTKH